MQNKEIKFIAKDMERDKIMAKEIESDTKAIQTRDIQLEIKKLRMRCLEAAVSLKISGDPEVIENKAEHFYNWLVNGEKK